MADSQRQQQLARLKTVLSTASIQTVVLKERGKDDPCMDYTAAQTPLIQIVPKSERPEYEISMHALWNYQVDIVIFFLDNESDEDYGESLTKELKDALGNDITLNGTCAECRLRSITTGGAYPLWEITFYLDISYEKRLTNA